MARCKARLLIEAENATIIEKAIAADNPGYVHTTVEGNRVLVDIEANSTGSMLTTLDDLLVNIKVANDVICGKNADEDLRD